jgi:hypothetical protein
LRVHRKGHVMRRRAVYGLATVLCAVFALSPACDDTRRDWDVCHSEPCTPGFFCDAQKRCVPIVAAAVEAGAESGTPDGSAIADGGDAAADSDASAGAAIEVGDAAALDGAAE